MAPKKSKDLAPKKSNAVKGGRDTRLAANDNLTVVRAAATPAKKDLSPSKNPRGGVKKA